MQYSHRPGARRARASYAFPHGINTEGGTARLALGIHAPRRAGRAPGTLACLVAAAMALGTSMAHAADVQTPIAAPEAAASGAVVSHASQTIVVTASRREQQIRSAPATISVITRQEIESKPYNNVMDVLGSVEGVTIVGSSPNDKDITLRGMSGEYSLLLVDGVRQGTRETMNRGTGGVQSYMLPPLSAIERIEVVRGPMSSLYGADAMGGVINIITRQSSDHWIRSFSLGTVLQQEDDQGNTQSGEFWAGGPLYGDKLSLQVSGRMSNREEDDIYYSNNATSGANGQQNSSLEARLNARPVDGQEFGAFVGFEQLNYLMTPGKSISASASSTTAVKTRHVRDYGGLTYQGLFGWGRANLSLSSEEGAQEQITRAGNISSDPKVRNTVLDGRVALPWGEGEKNTLTTGTQLTWTHLRGVSGQDSVPSGYSANVDSISRKQIALFAENDYAWTRKFTMTTGLRWDHDDKYGGHVSPRLYGVYLLDSEWSFRGGLATGFKAPTLRQSADGYCMTTGGALGAQAGTLCGNSDLKPETSFTQEAGVRWDHARDHVSATVFNTQFKNKVVSYDTGVADTLSSGRDVYVYDNISRVHLWGLELGGGTALGANWTVDANYTFTMSRREGGGESSYDGSSLDGKPLDKTPKHKLHAQVNWQAMPRLGLYASSDVVSKEYWAAYRNSAMGVRERPGEVLFNLGGKYTLTKGFDLKVALLNVTNKMLAVDTRTRAGGLDGNWLVDEGRRLAVTLSGEF